MKLTKGMKVAKVTAFLHSEENKPVINIKTGLVVEAAGGKLSTVDGRRFPADGAHELTPGIFHGCVYTVVPDTPEDIAKATKAAKRWLSERRKAIFGELMKLHAQFKYEVAPEIRTKDMGEG